jgi:protein-disulfide isomerase
MNSTLLFILALAATLLLVATISAFGMFKGTQRQPAALVAEKPAEKKNIEPKVAPSAQAPAKVNPKPPQPTSLVASTSPAIVKKAVEDLQVGERMTVVVKSDRCPWCQKFMNVLDDLKKKDDKTLGVVFVVDAEKDTKEAVGPTAAQGMESFRGLPHSIVIDRSPDQYTVASFGGYVPQEKLGEALASATKKKVDL